MLKAPANWNELYESGEYVIEPRIRFFPYRKSDGSYSDAQCFTVYADQISSSGVSLESSTFSDLSLGNVCSSCLRTTFKDMPSAFAQLCPKWTPLDFYVRLVSFDGVTETDWVQQGFFRVDEMTDIDGSGDFELVAYDDITYLESFYCLDEAKAEALNTFVDYAAKYTDIFDDASLGTTVGHGFFPPQGKLVNGKTLREILAIYVSEGACNLFVSKGNVAKASRLRSNVVGVDDGDPVSATAIAVESDMPPICGLAVAARSEKMLCSQSGYLAKLNMSAELIEEYDKVFSNVGDGTITFENAQLAALDRRMFFGPLSTDAVYREPITFADVTVDGAIVSPLFEIGDYVIIEVNGKLARFYPSGYRLTYAGDCIGSLFARRSRDATVLRRYEDDPSAWVPMTSYRGNSSITYTGSLERIGTSGWAVATFPKIYLATGSDIDQEKYNVAYYAGGDLADGRLQVSIRHRTGPDLGTVSPVGAYAIVPDESRSYFKVRPAEGDEPGMVVENLRLVVQNIILTREYEVIEDVTFQATSLRQAKFYISGGE